MRAAAISLAGVAVLAAAGWAEYRLARRTLEFRPVALIPVWERTTGRDVVVLPGRFLIADVLTYDDEFFAYLMFTYLRGTKEFTNREVLLTYTRAEAGILYHIQVHLPNDLLSSELLLAEAEAKNLIEKRSWRHVTADTLNRFRYETHLFQTAYNLPSRRKLEDMPPRQLIAYIRRFVRFKSVTDPRIRRRIEPIPQPLTSQEARQLAEDIVRVADFYSLPLDFFLGIGAMENNYMNIAGDLQHAVWKRRAEKGDIVLRRKAGKVLVLNSSVGVWQITRETLRYAHHLYLKDQRDYGLLPQRLRPSKELDMTNVDPATLTTYAGLLFRDLLDRCQGDVEKAVGAYNGGLGKPNAHYADGVEAVADYARHILERAALLNGPAAGRQFLSAGR